MDAHEEIVEAQAGFRKGHSTIDHITEKYLSRKGGKVCVSLFLTLVKAGLSGPFLNAIKALYRSVVSCVRVHNKVTAFFLLSFWCQAGVYSEFCSFFFVCK